LKLRDNVGKEAWGGGERNWVSYWNWSNICEV